VDSSLEFIYDAVGDILRIDLVPRYPEQESDMIGDHIVARSNPETGEVESVEILFFEKTLGAEGHLSLPLEARLLFSKALLEQWADEDARIELHALPG
jgi:hypothetical protein